MKKTENKLFLLKFAIAVFISTACLIAFYATGIGCVFRYFFSVPCPGCGLTRAFISLCRLDFKSAFLYNPLIYLMPVILLYIVCDGRVFKNKAVDMSVMLTILFCVILFYILRLTKIGGFYHVL